MWSESTRSSGLLERLSQRADALRIRSKVLQAIRSFFLYQGFLEVETPLLLSTVAPEEHIVPVPAQQRFLATSPELQMKLLAAAGLTKTFQISRSFRQGELGRKHNPEFSMLEYYRPGDSIHDLVQDLGALLHHVVLEVTGTSTFTWQGRAVEVTPALKSITVENAYLRYARWNPLDTWDPDRFDLDMGTIVEPNLGNGWPEALVLYPAQAASLARLSPNDARTAQRAELYVLGLELANGFVELNDPREQRARFLETSELIRRAGREPPPMPEEYLHSLEHLPPTVGMALGIDRLVMLLADRASISDVMAFPWDDV